MSVQLTLALVADASPETSSTFVYFSRLFDAGWWNL